MPLVRVCFIEFTGYDLFGEGLSIYGDLPSRLLGLDDLRLCEWSTNLNVREDWNQSVLFMSHQLFALPAMTDSPCMIGS